MDSMNTQVSGKVGGKSSSTAKIDNTFSIGLWTRSKSKVVAPMADLVGNDRTRTQTIITLGPRKDESSEYKKLVSILEDCQYLLEKHLVMKLSLPWDQGRMKVLNTRS
ncbi:hypothetical protein ACH5RR_037540 [Cinchona calisaya]|uniref:Uncharacterized protein n=1 Tax=Cinchona calisaya TaxID=153742 RepID=A0ABD2Y6H9_9GENT